MANRPIAFVDSGIGGLPYLSAARSLLPAESTVYVADSANFPYGEKSVSQVKAAVTGVVERLVATIGPKVIVLACNTASVAALSSLRKRFSVPFVGVVPAVKPAAAASPSGHIGVLATSRTVQDRYLAALIRDHASNCNVASVAAGGLVSFVERRLLTASLEERRRVVRDAAGELRERGVDTVVLGCTHFIHLRKELEEELGDGITIIDSVEGVARQVARIVEKLDEHNAEAPQHELYVTDGAAGGNMYRDFAARYGLELAGTL